MYSETLWSRFQLCFSDNDIFQVGRLSRQAGEEGAERRRVEKERDALLQRVREKETQLEQAQATLEDKEAKVCVLCT